MSETTDLAEVARAIAEQAERLDRARAALREHPEQVADVLDPLIRTLDSVARVVDAAGTAFQEHGATAVTMGGNQARGVAQAMRAGGLLSAASVQVQGLRNTLMHAGAESSLLAWPEHDPLAAEELSNYRRFLDQRERQLDPDAVSQPTAPDPRSRGSIDRS